MDVRAKMFQSIEFFVKVLQQSHNELLGCHRLRFRDPMETTLIWRK